ncbi:hypothetical protein QD712_25660 [Streptomyces acidiscabies]|uniref:hypothetical protein n=1 Tax=Streptomyces acidiscabies TaxID=42234 RepID=UPI0030CFF392
MSADCYLTITCDRADCDAEGHWPVREDPHTHTELRRLLKTHRGWARRRQDGHLLDLCPEHAGNPS